MLSHSRISPRPDRLVVAQNGAEIRAHYSHDCHAGPGSPIRKLTQLDQVPRGVNIEDRRELRVLIDKKEAAVLRTAEASSDNLGPAVAARTDAAQVLMLSE